MVKFRLRTFDITIITYNKDTSLEKAYVAVCATPNPFVLTNEIRLNQDMKYFVVTVDFITMVFELFNDTWGASVSSF